MNKLPDSLLDKIFQYKHQLEYAKVMEDLIQHKIHCRYDVTIGMLPYMFYMAEEGLRIPSIDVSNLDVYAFEILHLIKSKKLI